MNKFLIVITLIVTLISCGGSDNGDKAVGLKGVAHANYVKNGVIKLYGVKDDNSKQYIASVVTNDTGHYSFLESHITYGYKAYIIEAVSGTYIDEAKIRAAKANGKTDAEAEIEATMVLNSQEPIQSITYLKEGGIEEVAITPATDIVVKILEREGNFSEATRRVAAQNTVRGLLGAVAPDDLNLFTTQPVDLNESLQVENSQSNQKVYSSLMSGLSQLQQDTKKSIAEISTELSQNINVQNQGEAVQDSALLSQFRESFEMSTKQDNQAGKDTGIEMFADGATNVVTTNAYLANVAYKPNDKVVKDGVEYTCKAWPDGAWCASPVYQPGSALSSRAWNTDGGTANIVESDTDINNINYWSNQAYVAGNKIYYKGDAYECKGWPYTGWCQLREPGTNGWQDAWREYTGHYDVADNVKQDNDKKNSDDDAVQEEQENQAELALERPLLQLDQSDGQYTLLIYATYTNNSNRPDGYILYKDGQQVKEVAWSNTQDTIANEHGLKDDDVHRYFVKTYRILARSANERDYSNASIIQIIKAKKVTGTALNQPQSLLTTSTLSFAGAVGQNSGKIYINGGDGDGNLIVSSTNTSIARITAIPNYANQFIIEAIAVGNTSIAIQKAASSDHAFVASNVISIPVVIKDTTPVVTSDKTPGKPIIAWLAASVVYGDFGLKWNMWWGDRATTAKLYVDDVVVATATLDDFSASKGAQRGGFGYANAVTADTDHIFKVALCNHDICTVSNEKTVTFLAQNSTPPTTPTNPTNPTNPTIPTIPTEPPPAHFSSDHFAVGYLPSWGINWFSKANASSSQMVNIDPLYTHVVISFAQPNITYVKNSNSFQGTGIGFSATFDAVKEAVKLLKAKNVKVLLAVGGATYNNWSALANNAGAHRQALVDLITDLDLDGLDVDYEISGTDDGNIVQYYKSIEVLYSITQQTNTLLSIAGWSTGADCTAQTQSDTSCKDKTSFWQGNAGRERLVFNKMRADNLEPNDVFDYTAIMSYDGSFKRFDPILLYKNYQEIYSGKLAIGFELATEAWGGAELVSTDVEARSCDGVSKSSMLAGDSYRVFDTKKPYSVERLVNFIKTQPNSGIMLWSMYKAAGASPSCNKALSYQAFNASARHFLGGKALTEDEQLAKDIDEVNAQISTFKSIPKYIKLVNDANTLDGFTLDMTAITTAISDAASAYSGAKNAALKTSLENYLKVINDTFLQQKSNYEIALLRHNAEIEAAREQARTVEVYQNLRIKVNAGILDIEASFEASITTALAREIFNNDARTEVQAEIDKQKILVDQFKTKVTAKTNILAILFGQIGSTYSEENSQTLMALEQTYIVKKQALKVEFASLINTAIVTINALKPDDDKVNEDDEGTGTTPPPSNGGDNAVRELNILSYFDQQTVANGSGVSIILTYKKEADIYFRDAKIVISGDAQYTPDIVAPTLSWVNPREEYDYDNTTQRVLTTLVFDTFAKKYVDTLFGGIGSTITINFWPAAPINLDHISVVQVTPGKVTIAQEDATKAKPNRADSVALKVKGWPSTLAMGTVTDNDFGLNQRFFDSKVDAIFKYEGDGFGDRGDVIEPIVTTQTIRQAREIEALYGADKTRVMPTLVVYTANGSGGGLAQNDIKTNYKTVNAIDSSNNTVIEDSNLVKHFRNTIRMVANMQANKDDEHPNPATIVLNADLFGEWQKNKLNGSFQNEYCGGSDDIDCENYQTILVREAMVAAIEAEKNYMVKKYSSAATNATKTVEVDRLEIAYQLDDIKAKITETNIKNNIKGWVQAQNFMIKEFAPDVAFGWVINLWNPGSAHWVHKKYTGERDVWNNASKGVAVFSKWIGAYDDNDYRPDFLTFDKYERDGFGAAGKPSYAFASREWDNYLMYVKQITDFIGTPAMLWQIPGGHMVTKTENLSGESKLCANNESSECFRHLDTDTHGGHSASGGSYFMGDKKIGTDTNNIRQDVLDISLSGSHYNGATKVGDLLAQDSSHDWGVSELRHAVFSNAFAVLWGGGETTGSVPISTNKTGGYNWLKNKIVDYRAKGGIPLYHQKKAGDNDINALTSALGLNTILASASVANEMNSNVFLFNDAPGSWIPSSIYKWEDFLNALKAMHNTGISGDKYWLFDDSDSDEKKQKYGAVAIASFLAQSMQETIQYNACDENSWQFFKDANTSKAVADSIARGDFTVDQPMDASCGQLGQVYADYGVDSYGVDNPYSCPRAPKMEVTAITNAKYYAAAAPIFAAPDAVLSDLGLLLDGKPGRWEDSGDCAGKPATADDFEDPKIEGWARDECKIYKGQKAGSFVWDGSSKRSLEGCGWWGRGVIQTTGRENFGKLNHFVGRSHVDKDLIGSHVDWQGGVVEVKAPPENPLYADMDLCANPELICSSTEHKEIKWVAGLFYWMNSVQAYTGGGKYQDWHYQTELKKYVDSDFGQNNYQPLNGIPFVDAISGIVNRGCPDSTCPNTGDVHAKKERADNFKKVMQGFGIALDN
ncbi:Chitodextrinase [Bathymodiolus thermophilus thioautotrophic gill symbiont]|uniref:Chitodextrinase n=2 Tax=Bathymodiolus thermophilus thioautotrophic gill symbiont TaxID=2360 RepID=A0A3G3IKT6_9GAMM|nr:Chitodextrinase [Bathymodiolus thermophilus thioautotrophic gill symbiont]